MAGQCFTASEGQIVHEIEGDGEIRIDLFPTQISRLKRVQSLFKGDTLSRIVNYSLLCSMGNENLNRLVRIVLPAQILDYFTIASVAHTSGEMPICLDEKMNATLSADTHFESKVLYFCRQ